ncbi:MAG TPA: hypothetical protein VE993_11825, partial [Stellaceae bacterium]|nr:hypothetical protein [Stellaceae bacterium]
QQRGYGKAEALVYTKHPLRFNLFGQAKWLGRIYGDLSASLLFSRKPVIYSGTFGRGLFQTLYEPPSSLAALLPLTFEWSAAALVLALGGMVVGGWWRLLAVPLFTTWALCASGAMAAPIDARFCGPKARLLIAFLIYIAPLLRGWERTRWRLRALCRPERIRPIAVAQRPRISWLRRALHLSYWSETGAEKEVLLSGVMDFLKPQKYFVVPDTGWSGWDVQIARGLWSRALLLVCVENHGGGKRLFRVRCALRLSGLARALLRGYAAAAAFALMLGWPLAAAAIGGVGIAHLAVMGHRLAAFGRIMHCVVETVATAARLTPLSPPSRAPLMGGMARVA